jgi:hypothetical protein
MSNSEADGEQRTPKRVALGTPYGAKWRSRSECLPVGNADGGARDAPARGSEWRRAALDSLPAVATVKGRSG